LAVRPEEVAGPDHPCSKAMQMVVREEGLERTAAPAEHLVEHEFVVVTNQADHVSVGYGGVVLMRRFLSGGGAAAAAAALAG